MVPVDAVDGTDTKIRWPFFAVPKRPKKRPSLGAVAAFAAACGALTLQTAEVAALAASP